MEQYIPKSALTAEIKRRLKFIKERLKRNNSYTEEGNTAWKRDKALYDTYNFLLSFLDTFEVKVVDLEKEIDKVWNTDYEDFGISADDFYRVAKHFFELGLKVAQKGE